MSDRKYDLSLPEALSSLEEELESYREDSDRAQLKDIDADTAFELGYESAISDLRRFTGPNPVTAELRFIMEVPDGPEAPTV